MSGAVLTLFLLATFFGGLTSGVAGFAMGLVVSGVCLHLFTPLQTAALIAGYGFVTQGYALWKFRESVSWKSAAPFIVGGAIGVPIGTMLLAYTDPDVLRVAIGAFLVLYTIYGLARPALKASRETASIDVGVGVLNGLLGGLTGLSGIVIVIWCQMRNWPKDVQRGIFQPVLMATIVMATASLTVAGAMTVETVKIFLLGLPCMIAGTWVGLKLYGRLDDEAFRKVVLALLLVSGISLVVPFSWFG
jgi:uncharacterized protein